MEVLSNGRFPSTVHRAFGNPDCERFSVPFFFNPDPSSIIAPHPQILADRNEKPVFEPQNINQRTLKGMMTNRPDHSFMKKLRQLGLTEEELVYDLVMMPIEKIAAKHAST
jgi:isopenicillin N synthase-like dioxygenase